MTSEVPQDFRSDIKELIKVPISDRAFTSVCRTCQFPGISELEWALSYIYDHWNFETGDSYLRRYIDIIEKEIERRKDQTEQAEDMSTNYSLKLLNTKQLGYNLSNTQK